MGTVSHFPHRPNAPLNMERAVAVSGRSERTILRWVRQGLATELDADGKMLIRFGRLQEWMKEMAA